MTAFVACLALGCRTPCAVGFDRGDDGVCRAATPCAQGSQRGRDLKCHPMETNTETPDSGEPLDMGTPDSGGSDVDEPNDTGVRSEGPGSIRVLYNGLSGYPVHGFVVTGRLPDEDIPSSAFCQIILASEVDISGPLVAYDGMSDPCPSVGEAVLFEPGPVELSMILAQGAVDSPVFCDERTVVVNGDITVDFGDISGCENR